MTPCTEMQQFWCTFCRILQWSFTLRRPPQGTFVPLPQGMPFWAQWVNLVLYRPIAGASPHWPGKSECQTIQFAQYYLLYVVAALQNLRKKSWVFSWYVYLVHISYGLCIPIPGVWFGVWYLLLVLVKVCWAFSWECQVLEIGAFSMHSVFPAT